jgi:beta-glucosidase
VTNTGKVAGKEIVQVYVHDHKSSLVRPPKELKGFAKIELQPGETRTVSVALDARAFAFFHPAYRRWITEDGDFDILIGASSADIRITETVTLQSSLVLPSILDRASSLQDWLNDPRGKDAAEVEIRNLMAQMARRFGIDESEKRALGMDMMTFMLDMPLVSLFEFHETNLDVPADKLVDTLLARVYGDQKIQAIPG